MSKLPENLTAHESVWVHRLRQRIILERIILSVGNPDQQSRARQFLEAMENANPELFEDIEHDTPELFDETEPQTPELFDTSEYSSPKGRKTALKLPKDILWEEKIIRRAIREYRDLFHPCDNTFENAMKGLQYLNNIHPELFARATTQAVENRAQILNFEIYCKCDCSSKEERQPVETFAKTNQGRFKSVSRRISSAISAIDQNDESNQVDWRFFLGCIKKIAPEMLS